VKSLQLTEFIIAVKFIISIEYFTLGVKPKLQECGPYVFKEQHQGPILQNFFTAVIYEAVRFAPGKPFQLSLMFVGKAGSLP